MDQIVDRLNNYAAQTDLYLAQLRDKYYDQYKDILGFANAASTASKIQDIQTKDANLASRLQNYLNSFQAIQAENDNVEDQFPSVLAEWQGARAKCFQTVLAIQASAWCLACDPNYPASGVAPDGTIPFSSGLCQTITNDCYPFLSAAVKFNPLIRARQAFWKLRSVADYLNRYTIGSTPPVLNLGIDPYNPLPSQQTVAIPDGCTQAGCPWQCQNLFPGNGNTLNEGVLVVGAGVPAGDNLSGPVLNGDEALAGAPAPVTAENVEVQVENPVEVDVENPVEVVVAENPVEVQVENPLEIQIESPIDENQLETVVDAVRNAIPAIVTNNNNARLLQNAPNPAPPGPTAPAPGATWAPDILAQGLAINPRVDPGDYFGIVDDSDLDDSEFLNPYDASSYSDEEITVA